MYWLSRNSRFDILDLFWKCPERSIRGNHPVLSYVQLQIYKISKNVARSNIEFVSIHKIEKASENFKCSTFWKQLFIMMRMGWLVMSRRNERENGGDEHFIKLTLSLATSAHFRSFWQNSQNLLPRFSFYLRIIITRRLVKIYSSFIRQKCRKRRESGFHYRITINLLHPLLQVSTINTF